MGQEIAYRDLRLARLGEVGPVSSDRRVELEQGGLDETERADGGDRFPDRVEIDDRVAVPRSRPRSVGVAAPQVDDRPPVDVDGERGPDLGARDENRRERLAHALESALAESANDRAVTAGDQSGPSRLRPVAAAR